MIKYAPNSSELSSKHLLIAIVISMFCHALFLSFIQAPATSAPKPLKASTKITIAPQTFSQAKDLQALAPMLVNEVNANSLVVAQAIDITTDNTPDELPIADDGLTALAANPENQNIENYAITQEISENTKPTELSAASVPMLTIANTLETVTIKNVVPINKINTEVKANTSPSIEPKIFKAKIILSKSALEIVPEIGSHDNSLLGIDHNFKNKMEYIIVNSLNKIKPTLKIKKLQGKLRFEFTINRKGVLIDSKITKSSNKKQLDRLVLNMLKNNSPYVPLPKNYTGNSLKFSYPVDIKLK